MKTEIITINDKQYTRITQPANHEWIKEQLEMGEPVNLENEYGIFSAATIATLASDGKEFYAGFDELADRTYSDKEKVQSIVTTLPALPRYPKAEDMLLVHRYEAEGLNIMGRFKHDAEWIENEGVCCGVAEEITHAVDSEGNRIEVAICEN